MKGLERKNGKALYLATRRIAQDAPADRNINMQTKGFSYQQKYYNTGGTKVK